MVPQIFKDQSTVEFGTKHILSQGDTSESIVYKMSIILFGPECGEET